MTDEELCKGLRLLCFIPTTQAADRIEALTEKLKQLVAINEAARADAKETEAYAEELAEDQVDLCRQLIAAEDMLAKAVGLAKEAIETMASGPFFPDEEERRLLSKLAEIEGEKG
jgi:hypothetical protein